MAPARFGASKFRNATSSATPTETWYRTSLPATSSAQSTSSSSLSTFSSEIKTNRRWIVTVTPSGDVSWRSYSEGPVGTMKVGPVGDWDLSRLEDECLAIGGTDGNLRIYTLPSEAGGDLNEEQVISVGSPITTVSLHPSTPSLVLVAATQSPLSVYDVAAGQKSSGPAFMLEVEEPKGMWTAGWSNDGTLVAAVGRSGKGYIFDPRQSTKPVTTKVLPLQPLKPVRLVWVDDKIFLTGWDRSRNRLYTLLNPADLSTIFTQNLDTNLSPLHPTVDEERNIIYLAGRGDMKLRQVELGGVTGFQETIHPLHYGLASTSLATVHPTLLDVMQAEIGRILVPVVDKDGDAILPLSIKVPRRQLIDYHEDLYPDIAGSIPEQASHQWLAGEDARPQTWTLDPARRSMWENQLAQRKASTGATQIRAKPQPVETVAPVVAVRESEKPSKPQEASQAEPPAATGSSGPSSSKTTKAEVPDAPSSTESTTPREKTTQADETGSGSADNDLSRAPVPGPSAAVSPTTSSEAPPSDLATSSSKPSQINSAISAEPPQAPRSAATKGTQFSSERYNPNWSRKFLAGKTPLIPTYDAVPPLSSLHQDSIIFKINAHLAFFPVQGPGGRLGVHPLKKKGRMANGGEGYLSGGVEIADFDVEPFGSRVAIAGEDGLIRLWTVGEDGIQGVGPEAEQVIKGEGIDKIATIAFHPTAKNLLTVLTNDQGTCAIRLLDLSQGKEVKKIPLDLDGAFNMIWLPSGNKVAVATKDGRILTLDPRRPESQVLGPAHDSPRSFQITWIDETHLLSVGFSRGSQRRINLYQTIDTAIKTLSSFMMDISPSVLFPQYDPDTHILYVWGKGERQIQAFEIRPENDLEPIAKLPSFTSGSPQLGVAFFAKRSVDVKKVEVAKVLRLTAKAIEEVSFTIPRNKPEFFQDDIYVDTLDTEHSTTTAEAWLDEKKVDSSYISLKPEDMTSLSQAPKTDTAAKKKFVPAANVMSEEERKRKEMNDLFQRAKMDESSDEDEPKRSGLPPPDDDW